VEAVAAAADSLEERTTDSGEECPSERWWRTGGARRRSSGEGGRHHCLVLIARASSPSWVPFAQDRMHCTAAGRTLSAWLREARCDAVGRPSMRYPPPYIGREPPWMHPDPGEVVAA